MTHPAISAKQILKATSLFGDLADSDLEALASSSKIRSYPQGEILFMEGQPCAGLYIVIAGRIRIFKTSTSGREQVLAVEGTGSSVAELPVFDGGPYPASASAVNDAETLFVSRDALRALCLERPEISLKLLEVLGSRLRRLVGIIEELSFTTVRQRLIAWLLRTARSGGANTARGLVVTLNASHQELASQIGTVRELVSRNLARLQAQGFIEIDGREIAIVNEEALGAELSLPV